jgi:hypothetical protein
LGPQPPLACTTWSADLATALSGAAGIAWALKVMKVNMAAIAANTASSLRMVVLPSVVMVETTGKKDHSARAFATPSRRK